MPAGRPTTYTPELADHICALLAEGQSMRTVCLPDEMPAKSTVFKWLRTIPEFSDRYAQAKAEAADALTEEMLDIADDGTNDWVERETQSGTKIVLDQEHVQRSKLRIDTRKWIASKLKPKRYGDKLTHQGDPDNPVHHKFETVIDNVD